MKVRQGGSWVNVNTYIRQNNQWVYVGNFSDANEFLLVISQTTTDLNLQTAFTNRFGASAWTSTKRKRVVINPGVVVGSLSSVNYALTIPAGLGGTLTIDNLGSILGAGGAANGGTGGSAILANSPVSINNQGSIYAGGGGGGRGGNGGTGGQGIYSQFNSIGYTNGCPYDNIGYGAGICNNGCPYTCVGGGNNYTCTEIRGSGYFYYYYYTSCGDCYNCGYYTNVITNGGTGGAGGNGGVGRGYNQSLSSGSGGSAGSAGGINAGTGGTGGTGGSGGDWGESGSAGNTGGTGSNGNYTGGSGGAAGSTGGLAGFYIVNNGNVTWTNNGTRLGRVG